MVRIGIRELRQNASRYIVLVKAGETIEVTERGQPVALLTPLPKGDESPYQRLLREGKIIPATRNLRELPDPAPRVPGERLLSEILQAMRDEDDR